MSNQGCTYTEQILLRSDGCALLDYLSGRYLHTPEGEWRERIQAGLVRIDGRSMDPGTPLKQGQILTWSRPPWEEPEVPLDYGVIYEDADLVAVAKPSGLPTLPGAGFLEHTLLHQVRLRFPGADPIHRLGRTTSGIVVFARSPGARKSLSQALREHKLVKVYRALVTGWPELDAFTVDAPIGPLPHPLLGTLHGPSPAGKPAVSHVRVLERREDASLVEVHIETGRPHQIRIHMAVCGHPLVGDPLYGPGGVFLPGAVPGDGGYLLHAMTLNLPLLGLELECPPPYPLKETRA
ncbi:RluA family pseudouridine synthase [Holophaga foetida]|uniref:RluA family pseudouridine synthase n=1 Tax=Holophaga foetida TaxID=35839 RepID=UPI0002472EA9|nr:RluA family pseudouridine synthase [Holophaga foetida]